MQFVMPCKETIKNTKNKVNLQNFNYFRSNNCWYSAVQAVDDMHSRACYEMFADVMIVTNAIRDSIASGAMGMGLENENILKNY